MVHTVEQVDELALGAQLLETCGGRLEVCIALEVECCEPMVYVALANIQDEELDEA